MPKVEKSRRRAHEADDDVLEEAGPTAMATAELAGDEPVKPTFAPLSAQEQSVSGKRLDFRRVRTLRMLSAAHGFANARPNKRPQSTLQVGLPVPFRHRCGTAQLVC